MILFPAIDLKDQHCVRLSQGLFNQTQIYSNNPLEIAQSFAREGAEFLHVVDLNGANDDQQTNETIICELAKQLPIPIQVGGGIRTLEKAATLLNAGVNRIILGTIAIENLDLLKKLVQIYPKRIVVSIDAKQGMVATRAWKTTTTVSAIDLCRKLEEIGIDTIVYTDIEKDGMLAGPNFQMYEDLSLNTKLNIIASGGVSTKDDLIKLNQIGLYGAIIGKALYEKKLTLKEAIACLKQESFPV